MDQITTAPVTADAREDLERLRLQEELARQAGFALRPPVFALGTRVVEVGQENFRRSRAEFEALPPAREALRGLAQRVALEARRDTDPVPVRELTMLPSGEVTRGQARLLLTDRAFAQLVGRTSVACPSAAATYLASIPPARRAAEWNELARATPEGATAVLRHRATVAGGPLGHRPGRHVFAAVSESYTARDADQLARDAAAVLDSLALGDVRAAVEYDGETAEMRLEWHSDVQPSRVCAGEVFRASAGVRCRDDGGMSIQAFSGVIRNLCLNLIILDRAEVKARKRHVGDGARLGTAVAEELASAVERVSGFAALWDGARSALLDDVVRDAGALADVPHGEARDAELVRGTFRGLLAAKHLSLPGHRREAAVEALLGCWRAEPEPTLSGVVNAVTRAAHTVELRGAWAAQEVEQAAAAILAGRARLRYLAADEAL